MARGVPQRWLSLPLLAVGAWFCADLLGGCLPPRAPAPAADLATVPRIVVLVFDGVDHTVAREYLDADELPALAALAREGALYPLRSETPPESPVALASMLTGVNPGRHELFDFVLRGSEDEPDNGMVEVVAPRLLGGRVPVRPPRLRSRLAAPTFTESVWQAGYSVVSLREPLLFPVPHRPGARMTSGLGTPDLAGSAGFYTIYSDRLGFEAGTTIFGGLRVPLAAGEGDTGYDTWLEGPQDLSLGEAPGGGRRRARVPLRLEPGVVDGVRGVRIRVQDSEAFVAHGDRSPFFDVRFPLATLPTRSVAGIVRFEVRGVGPVEVMADPVQIDPRDPPFALSSAPDYGAWLWEAYGPHETMGWQEQTFALNDRFQDDAGFTRDLLEDMDRATVTLLREMQRVPTGRSRTARCVFYTFTATDRACHAFFRHRDPGHPEHDAAVVASRPDPILAVFRRMDDVVGRVRALLEPEDTLLVCSDHGFETWRWQVHVNQWLVDHGYLVLTKDADRKDLAGFFGKARRPDGVDWSRTRAFALGLGQVYLNLQGRNPRGIVAPEERRALVEELRTGLLDLRNPYLTEADRRDGIPEQAVRSVAILEDAWTFGPEGPPAHVPDLQIGFDRGYRISWQTALLGGMRERGDVFELNRMPWSGDHCSTDPELVEGVLFCNRPLPPPPAGRPYHVRDVAATVLAHFGLDRAHQHGESSPLPLGPAAGAVR